MSPERPTIRRREDVYQAWDKRSVIIREQAVGSTIVYPQLPRGVSYRGFSLREEYVLARVRTIREGIHWADHQHYRYTVLGGVEIRGPQ